MYNIQINVRYFAIQIQCFLIYFNINYYHGNIDTGDEYKRNTTASLKHRSKHGNSLSKWTTNKIIPKKEADPKVFPAKTECCSCYNRDNKKQKTPPKVVMKLQLFRESSINLPISIKPTKSKNFQ